MAVKEVLREVTEDICFGCGINIRDHSFARTPGLVSVGYE
jgi:hypothetical protein